MDYSNLYLLADPREGSVERYVHAIADDYDRAMRSDVARDIKQREEAEQRNLTLIALLDRLAKSDATDPALAARRDSLWEANLEQEANARLLRRTLRQHPATAR